MLFEVVSGTVQSQLKVWLRDGPLEKLWGAGGDWEFSSRRNFFFVIKFLE